MKQKFFNLAWIVKDPLLSMSYLNLFKYGKRLTVFDCVVVTLLVLCGIVHLVMKCLKAKFTLVCRLDLLTAMA